MLTQYLIVFFVSMVPLIELRGAIPIAEAMNLPFVPVLHSCYFRKYASGSHYLFLRKEGFDLGSR